MADERSKLQVGTDATIPMFTDDETQEKYFYRRIHLAEYLKEIAVLITNS